MGSASESPGWEVAASAELHTRLVLALESGLTDIVGKVKSSSIVHDSSTVPAIGLGSSGPETRCCSWHVGFYSNAQLIGNLFHMAVQLALFPRPCTTEAAPMADDADAPQSARQNGAGKFAGHFYHATSGPSVNNDIDLEAKLVHERTMDQSRSVKPWRQTASSQDGIAEETVGLLSSPSSPRTSSAPSSSIPSPQRGAGLYPVYQDGSVDVVGAPRARGRASSSAARPAASQDRSRPITSRERRTGRSASSEVQMSRSWSLQDHHRRSGPGRANSTSTTPRGTRVTTPDPRHPQPTPLAWSGAGCSACPPSARRRDVAVVRTSHLQALKSRTAGPPPKTRVAQ